MRKINIIILLILLTAPVYTVSAEKAASLPQLLKPEGLVLDKEQLYVGDGTTIYIYSLKDYSLVGRFGKKGEGPQEFITAPNTPLRFHIDGDNLLVCSMRKLSYFSKKGGYIKETAHSIAMGTADLFPMNGGRFAVLGFAMDENAFSFSAEIYDKDLKKVKEIKKLPFPIRGQKFKMLDTAIYFQANRDTIFISGERDFIIDAFDNQGIKKFTIKQDYDLLKFTNADKKRSLDFFKTNPATKQFYEIFEKNAIFPSDFPAVRSFFVTDQRLYVQTYRVKDGKTEFYVFDANGKLLEKVRLPIVRSNPMQQIQLITFSGGKLYQVVENEDEEEWELHIEAVK